MAALMGCASPGPPRPPSLQLPQIVKDLAVQREGEKVTVRFTVPQRTTDGMPIREASVRAALCRGGEAASCDVIPGLKEVGLRVISGTNAAQRTVTWVDRLPPADIQGAPRLLEYRIELRNEEGRTAGWSEAAYTAAGVAPAAVDDLRAEETPQGILLRWSADAVTGAEPRAGDVILRRTDQGPEKRAPEWLETHARSGAGETLDVSATEHTEYEYVAFRRRTEDVGGRKVEVRSAESNAVEIMWLNRFPPAAPTALTAAPFAEGGHFAVDLVWEPVEQPGLKGYVVTRREVDSQGAPVGEEERLGTVALPAFHDATAKQGVRYRYSVRAVSAKEVEGAAATVMVEADSAGVSEPRR